jgi:hypothetical protein
MNRFKNKKVERLSEWLEIATKGLAQAGKQRIAQEIEAHFAESVDAHLTQGEPEQVAQANALAELGDPRAAGKRFRRKHLTQWEAKRLGQLQKYAGSSKSLLLTYFIWTSCYFGTVRKSGLSAERLKSHLILFLFGFFLCGFVLPTISFIIVRGHWFRRKVALVALVMFIGAPVMGLAFALFLNNSVGVLLLLLGILDAYSWLRIWNKVRKAGGDGNGAPRPA